MKDFLTGLLAGILAVAFVLGVYAFVAWVVSVLVTYLFGIQFGFWTAAAACALLYIFSRILSNGFRDK